MTHSTKIIVASFLFTVGLFMNTLAQRSFDNASAEQAYANSTVAPEADHETNAVLSASPATEARFSALFPNASNLLWSASNNNYWVSFLNEGRKANASFTPKGKMNYIITDCGMQHLPEAFSNTIAKEYAAYKLFKATEIRAYGAVVYQAILENSTRFTTLQYTIDGVEKIRELKKQ